MICTKFETVAPDRPEFNRMLLCLFYFWFVWPTADPHADNCHQVWSWYYHPLQTYSVFVADTLHDLDLLILNSCHTWQVMWSSSTKFEDPTPIRSWVKELKCVPQDTIKNADTATAHAPNQVTGEYGVINSCIFGIPDPYLPIHYTTFIGLQRLLRVWWRNF